MYTSLSDVRSVATLGKCDVFPRSANLSGASDEVMNGLRGADASVRSFADKMRYLRDIGETNASEINRLSATSFLRQFTNANFANGKATMAALTAIDNVVSKGPFRSTDPDRPYYAQQEITDLLYAVCPFIGLYDPYSPDETTNNNNGHLSDWEDVITLGFVEGNAATLHIKLTKPASCYVSIMTDGTPSGYWAQETPSDTRGFLKLKGKNFEIGCYFHAKVEDDPQWASKHTQLYWKPLLATLIPDKAYGWWCDVTAYDAKDPAIPCLETIDASGTQGFVTLTRVMDVNAEYIGYYDAVSSLLDQCNAQFEELSHSQVMAILDSYSDNNAVALLKSRLLAYQSPSVVNLLGTVSSLIADAQPIVNEAGTAYTGMNSNPNYIDNLLQATCSTLTTIGGTVLQVVGSLLGGVWALVTQAFSSVASYVMENLDATRATLQASGSNVLFNAAMPSLRQAFPAHYLDDMPDLYKRGLEETYSTSFATCLGPAKETWVFIDGTTRMDRPRMRSRLVPLLYSNGGELIDEVSSGAKHLMQIALTPSDDGQAPVFCMAESATGTTAIFDTQTADNFLSSKFPNYNGVDMLITQSGSDSLSFVNERLPVSSLGSQDPLSYSDDRLAYEFGAAVAEWCIRSYIASRSSNGDSYDKAMISPNVTDQSSPLARVGLPSWSHNGFGADAQWDYQNSSDSLSALYPNASSDPSQWKDWFFSQGGEYIHPLYLALSYVQLYSHTGSKSARWDDVMAFYLAVKDSFPNSTALVFQQMLHECCYFSSATSVPEVTAPAIMLPTISRKSLIGSALVVGGAAALIVATAAIAKRTLRKATIKRWFNTNNDYAAAAELWKANPSTENYAALYRANRKLGRASRWCKVMGIKSVGGWDPTGYYSANSKVPTEKSVIPFAEILSGPYMDQSFNDIRYLITGDNV